MPDVLNTQTAPHLLLHNLLGHVEADAGTLRLVLSGEVGLKDAIAYRLGYATAVIDHLNTRRELRPLVAAGCVDGDLAIGLIALDQDIAGVVDQVEQHLGVLVAKPLQAELTALIERYADVILGQIGLNQPDRFAGGAVEIKHLRFAVGVKEVSKVLDGL